MPEETPPKEQVDRFIMDEIDSVPELEALLLIWNHRPKGWSREEMEQTLYVSKDVAQYVLDRLARRGLIVEVEGSKGRYAIISASNQREGLIAALDQMYRKELVRVSKMIHSKAPRSLLDFARAFRLKKDG